MMLTTWMLPTIQSLQARLKEALETKESENSLKQLFENAPVGSSSYQPAYILLRKILLS